MSTFTDEKEQDNRSARQIALDTANGTGDRDDDILIKLPDGNGGTRVIRFPRKAHKLMVEFEKNNPGGIGAIIEANSMKVSNKK